MSLDPEIARIVAQLGSGPYLDLAALPLGEAMMIARPPFPDFAPAAPCITTGDVEIAVEGGAIPLRWYRPDGGADLPIVLHIHGGGWVTGSIQQEDLRCQFMAGRSEAVIVSIGYRLSPEARFPVPVLDCLAAWDWAEANAAAIGGDARRMAVSGSSAGGQLAVAMMLALRAEERALPCFQLLTYPALDPSFSYPSYAEFADGPFMTRDRMAWYWDQYLGRANRFDPLLAIMEADFTGLPPALVQLAELDVLRDEGRAYAERLGAAGTAAEVRCHPGMIHGFIAIAPNHPRSMLAMEEGCAALRDNLR